MAVIESWFEQDLKKPVKVQIINGNMFSQDNQANMVGVAVLDNGTAASLTGTVTANIIRADGGTVTATGTLSGNKCSVQLPAAAYAIPGRAIIVLKLTNDSVITTLLAVVVTVYRSSTDTAIDPGTIIPSVTALVSQIETAVASIPADYSSLWTSLAPAFSTSASYTPGQYVTNGGVLYICTTAHTGSWNAGHFSATNAGGELTRVNGAINALIDGTPAIIDALADSELQNGNYAVNDNISSPTASNYRKAYTVGFELSDGSTFVANTGGLYNIAFCAFDSSGKCISVASSWLTDGTYTAAQVKTNAGSSSGAKYSFQIKGINGGNISGTTIKASQYYHLYEQRRYQIGTASIENGAVTEEKLSSELQEIINSISPSPTPANKLQDVLLVSGSYSVNDNLSSPPSGNYRKAYNIGFELTDDMVFTASTNGAYNIAFCAFNSSGVCISTPSTWLTDGTYSASQIMSNAGSTSGAKYTFQIKKIDGTSMASEDVETLDYYSLTSTGTIDTVDVIMFMGQSNMAGRGEVANAPALIPGAGYEYRAISAPNSLSPMVEPFGVTENNPNGINEGSAKTGSMVVAFTNAYYTHNGGIPVIGISASKGGTPISDWQSGGAYLTDAIARLSSCVAYLSSKGYTIRHKYILWCQGETDGDDGTTGAAYKTLFDSMLATMKAQGIEKLFMVRIGNYNSGSSTKYVEIMNEQTEIAQTEADVVMASTDFAGMRSRGLMKDQFHYYQAGYNEIGTYSGINVAIYVNTGKEPTMYDTQDGSLYYSHKN